MYITKCKSDVLHYYTIGEAKAKKLAFLQWNRIISGFEYLFECHIWLNKYIVSVHQICFACWSWICNRSGNRNECDFFHAFRVLVLCPSGWIKSTVCSLALHSSVWFLKSLCCWSETLLCTLASGTHSRYVLVQSYTLHLSTTITVQL